VTSIINLILKRKENSELKILNGLIFIIGPNGSGKSALLQKAGLPYTFKRMGLTTVVEVDNRRVRDPFPHTALGNLAPAFSSFYSLDSYLKTFSGWPGFRQADARLLVETLALEPYRRKRLFQCSEGTRRKIGLIFSLCWDRPLILLDEADAFLDDRSVRKLLAYLDSRASAGATVLVSTQRPDLAREFPHAHVVDLYPANPLPA
jgi:ABC-type multidrug transport system ATPase subunit